MEETEEATRSHSDLLCQALPVAPLDEIDITSPPISGEDYLTRVRYFCPSISALLVLKHS